MQPHTSVDTTSTIAAPHAAPPEQNRRCKNAARWRPVKVCHDARDRCATIHAHNVHKRADELVYLVRQAVVERSSAVWPVCTHSVFVCKGNLKLKPWSVDNNKPPSSAAWPTLLDGDNAMKFPTIYGLLCTIFEWFRVAVGGQWALGPYDMRYWEFMHGVAPVPYVPARDDNAPHHVLCARTGFRRWTVAAMLHQLRTRYCVSGVTLSYLSAVLPST